MAITAQLALRDADLEALQRVFGRFPSLREVRIFGSRVTGGAGRTSDIDLAINAPEMTIREWSDFVEAIESAPVGYEIDIVRCDSLENDSLRQRIAVDGVVIYSVK